MIASGRRVGQEVVEDPSALARRWDMNLGEHLLALVLVHELYDDVVGEEWSPDGRTSVQSRWLEWRGKRIERTCVGLHTDDRQVLWAEAHAEVRGARELVAATYRMPPMPP